MMAPGWWKFVTPPAALGAALLPVSPPLSLVCLGASAFLAFFFRNPPREPPSDPSLAVSPADGRLLGYVMEAGEVPDDELSSYLDDPVTVSVFMSPLDVHVNRAPLDGRVAEVEILKGRFRPAFRKDSATENNRAVLLFDGDPPFVVRLVSGAVARRIDLYVQEGDEVKKGEPIGMIRFGSRVDLAVPRSSVEELLVRKGDSVKAGETPVIRVKR